VWPAAAIVFVAAFVVAYTLLASRSGTPVAAAPKIIAPAPKIIATAPVRATATGGIDDVRARDLAKAGRARQPLSPEAIFNAASPGVVLVETFDLTTRRLGQGSGFVVSADGLIATNHHVIRNAHTARVTFSDNRTCPVQGVATADPDSDLVVLKVVAQNLHTLPLAMGDVARVGAKVYAIGNPEGNRNTLSDGLVSGLRGSGGSPASIQTTAAISPGSSGGPLLSEFGEVIGITAESSIRGQNLNFAIPVSRLVALVRNRDPLRLLDTLGRVGRVPEEGWNPWERRNLVFFFLTLKCEAEAVQGVPTRRNLTQQDLQTYCSLLVHNTPFYARLVDASVLKKVHPDLPRVFREKLLPVLETAERLVVARAAIPPDLYWTREAWAQWWLANARNLRFPDELPVYREFGLTDEWARRWHGVRFPRFVQQ
jgi:hypothetical protein